MKTLAATAATLVAVCLAQIAVATSPRPIDQRSSHVGGSSSSAGSSQAGPSRVVGFGLSENTSTMSTDIAGPSGSAGGPSGSGVPREPAIDYIAELNIEEPVDIDAIPAFREAPPPPGRYGENQFLNRFWESIQACKDREDPIDYKTVMNFDSLKESFDYIEGTAPEDLVELYETVKQEMIGRFLNEAYLELYNNWYLVEHIDLKVKEWLDMLGELVPARKWNAPLLESNFEAYNELLDPQQNAELEAAIQATMTDNAEPNFANKWTAHQTGREGVCEPTVPEKKKEFENKNNILRAFFEVYHTQPKIRNMIVMDATIDEKEKFLMKTFYFYTLCRNLRKKVLPDIEIDSD